MTSTRSYFYGQQFNDNKLFVCYFHYLFIFYIYISLCRHRELHEAKLCTDTRWPNTSRGVSGLVGFHQTLIVSWLLTSRRLSSQLTIFGRQRKWEMCWNIKYVLTPTGFCCSIGIRSMLLCRHHRIIDEAMGWAGQCIILPQPEKYHVSVYNCSPFLSLRRSRNGKPNQKKTKKKKHRYNCFFCPIINSCDTKMSVAPFEMNVCGHVNYTLPTHWEQWTMKRNCWWNSNDMERFLKNCFSMSGSSRCACTLEICWADESYRARA